jgi:hypothetical protein
MSVWPPGGIGFVPRNGRASSRDFPTFSWLYMPFIMDAAGANLDTMFRPEPSGIHRGERWRHHAELLGAAMRDVGITLDSLLEEAGPMLHLSARRQEVILGLNLRAGAFATEEAWRLVLEVQWALQDVHSLVGPVRGDAVQCAVCRIDLGEGDLAVLPPCHPTHALHEACARPLVVIQGGGTTCPCCGASLIPPPPPLLPPGPLLGDPLNHTVGVGYPPLPVPPHPQALIHSLLPLRADGPAPLGISSSPSTPPPAVRGLWYGIDMSVWPPRGIGTVPRNEDALSRNLPPFAWLYMPFILDAAGAVLDTLFRPEPSGIHRGRRWRHHTETLGGAMANAGITLDMLLEEAGPTLHLSAERQEVILGLNPQAANFATEEAWRLVLDVQRTLEDVHSLVGPVCGEAVQCAVCRDDLVEGESAVLPPCHPSHALHEACARPLVVIHGNAAVCPSCRAPLIPPPPPPPPPHPLGDPASPANGAEPGSAHQPIVIDANSTVRAPRRQASCVLCEESFGATRYLVAHVRGTHPGANMADLQRMGLGGCRQSGGCGEIMTVAALQNHVDNPRPCQPPRVARRAAPPVSGLGAPPRIVLPLDGGDGGDDGDERRVMPDASWEWVANMAFGDILPCAWPSVEVPHRAGNLFAECMMLALQRAVSNPSSSAGIKLLLLLPRLLLCPLPRGQKGLQGVVVGRCRRFLLGEWEQLYTQQAPDMEQRVQAAITDERVRIDATRLVKLGEFKKAVERLKRAMPAPPTEATVAVLEGLHPPANPAIIDPTAGVATPPPIELLREFFDAVMRDLPRASSPGPSQMRWEHLHTLYKGGGGDLLFAFCKMMAHGDLPEEARPWFGGARLVAMLKNMDADGQPILPPLGGVRPIAMGEVLRKLVGKVICKQLAPDFRAHFCPDTLEEGETSALHQVGVAVRGGADRMVHSTRAHLECHPDWACVSIDCTNAFNALSRAAMMAAVRAHFPQLLAFTQLGYGEPPPLFFRMDREHRILRSREGTQQGDPLGCLYMALPLHEVLTDLHQAHPGVVIIAYVDDIVILGPPELARQAYLQLVELLRTRLGLSSNPAKCSVFSPTGDVSAFPSDMTGARASLEGIVVLGVPIGSDLFVQQTVLQRVQELGLVVPLLDLLRDPQMQYLLLRCCAHPRVSYMLRGVPPALARLGAEQHDTTIREGLQRILPGAVLSERAARVAGLPVRIGGMGLTSAVRVSPAAYLGSWALVMAPLAASSVHLRGLVDMAELVPCVRAVHAAFSDQVLPAIDILRQRSVDGADLPPRVPSVESTPSPQQFAAAPNPRAQKAYAAALLSREWCDIADDLEDDTARAWFMSISHHSLGGQFLMAVPKFALFTLTPAIFQTAVRFRLRETQPVALPVRACGGCGLQLDDEACHYIHCRGGSGIGGGNYFTSVHDAMLREVVDMLRTVHPRSRVVAEDYVGAMSYSPLHRPDVTIMDAGGYGVHTLVELTVFRATAVSNVRPAARMGPGGTMVRTPVGESLAARQEARRAGYGEVGPHRLLVFAVDEYGMLSRDAERLLRECIVTREDRLDVEGRLSTWSCRTFSSFWRQRLSITLVRRLASVILLRAQRDYRIG